MKKIQIIPGTKYGKLTIIKEVSQLDKWKRRVLCICECGTEIEVNMIPLKVGNTLSCGCLRQCYNQGGPNNPNWKGGTHIDGGYRFLYMPDYPGAKPNGYVREHKVIMEKFLGRRLLHYENVHHLNGDKLDNRIENLELWSSSQPPGQRVEDKLKWAKEIIKLYENYK